MHHPLHNGIAMCCDDSTLYLKYYRVLKSVSDFVIILISLFLATVMLFSCPIFVRLCCSCFLCAIPFLVLVLSINQKYIYMYICIYLGHLAVRTMCILECSGRV